VPVHFDESDQNTLSNLIKMRVESSSVENARSRTCAHNLELIGVECRSQCAVKSDHYAVERRMKLGQVKPMKSLA